MNPDILIGILAGICIASGYTFISRVRDSIFAHLSIVNRAKQHLEVEVHAGQAKKEIDLLSARCDTLKKKMLEINELTHAKNSN
jgi:hypothetical protein